MEREPKAPAVDSLRLTRADVQLWPWQQVRWADVREICFVQAHDEPNHGRLGVQKARGAYCVYDDVPRATFDALADPDADPRVREELYAMIGRTCPEGRVEFIQPAREQEIEGAQSSAAAAHNPHLPVRRPRDGAPGHYLVEGRHEHRARGGQTPAAHRRAPR